MKRNSYKFFAFSVILSMIFTALPAPRPVLAAGPAELFISEYIEGSNNNKAIEIYNGTGAAVDLGAGGYKIQMFFNGNSTAGLNINLTGMVADGDVFVVAQSSSFQEILDQTDQTNGAGWFNGDDAVVLSKGSVIIDVIGQIGTDPGSEWGTGLTSTADNTLRRKATVCVGDPDGSNAFDPSVEWDGYATNTFDGLGSHTATCGTVEPPPTILINEVDSDTPSTDVLEFVELYDGGVGNSALDGLVVVFYNGSNDLSYASYDLDGYSTDANGYFLLGNAGVIPTPGIPFAGNFLQNGADAVALFIDDASNFPNGTAVTTSNLLDAIVYDTADADDAGLLTLLNTGQPQVNESGGGDSAGQSNQRCPNGSGGTLNTDTYAQFAPTPGDENICVTPVAVVKIHDVQGNGPASPLVGQTVAIEGIVVGDFQDGASGTNGDLNGFHVQEEDSDADADPLTSEGIFVYNGSSPAVNVQIGDLVRVEGAVSEFSGMTEISSFTGVTVVSSGNALPIASNLSLPVANVDDFEAYEGMYVTFPQALVISEYFNFDRYNEIVLTSERHLTPTAKFEPGDDAILAAQAFLLDKITLDDGRTIQNPDPAIHPNGGEFTLANLFRGGDTVANVTGVMDYSFSLYRIQPTQGADYTSANPRTATPEDVGGSLKVVSMNTLNFFTTLTSSGSICGPLQNQDCRGADTTVELERQRDKLIAAITTMDADVIGLLEIENNINDEAVIDLVESLNTAYGFSAYDYVSTGTIGGDAIKVALIYKPASVSLVGDYAILDSTVDLRFIDTKNRPTLAQSFMDNNTGGIFTVAVNHLKSKGSACDDVGDFDSGDGAGNCNGTRTLAAQALVDWLATDPTGSGDADFLIVGDLNSYDKEDPIDAIKAGADDVLGTADDYTDLVFDYQGEDAYSYVFDGQIGYLDYGLANASLASQITGVADWHVNADEPDLIDYDMSFKEPDQAAIYAPDAYRYSDHDPVIIGLNVCDTIAPEFESVSVTPDVLWPANHKYVDVTATVVVSDNFDQNPTVNLVSIISSEADEGLGDGDFPNDIVIVDDFHFKLRAERSAVKKVGRYYTITYMVTDACGNTATQSVTVFVPFSMKKK